MDFSSMISNSPDENTEQKAIQGDDSTQEMVEQGNDSTQDMVEQGNDSTRTEEPDNSKQDVPEEPDNSKQEKQGSNQKIPTINRKGMFGVAMGTLKRIQNQGQSEATTKRMKIEQKLAEKLARERLELREKLDKEKQQQQNKARIEIEEIENQRVLIFNLESDYQGPE
jgi:hypothetical protein